MSDYYARCSCHPTVDIGTGEMCLNCKDSVCKTRRENGTGGYCNNSTRQADWFSHRKDVRYHGG
jgi:hypothetical protein